MVVEHENPMVRADMIYYKTPKDGAMFAPGSLSLVWKFISQ
jgi:hypothetical protein